jgi:hypothetical protein
MRYMGASLALWPFSPPIIGTLHHPCSFLQLQREGKLVMFPSPNIRELVGNISLSSLTHLVVRHHLHVLRSVIPGLVRLRADAALAVARQSVLGAAGGCTPRARCHHVGAQPLSRNPPPGSANVSLTGPHLPKMYRALHAHMHAHTHASFAQGLSALLLSILWPSGADETTEQGPRKGSRRKKPAAGTRLPCPSYSSPILLPLSPSIFLSLPPPLPPT